MSFSERTCIKLADLFQELDTSWANAHHIILEQLDNRKVYACWLSSLTDDHKAHCARLCVMHLTGYADQGEQFLQCIVIGDEMWVICAKPKTRKAAMLWKHHLLLPKNSEQCDQ
jgi:hypothetical protein